MSSLSDPCIQIMKRHNEEDIIGSFAYFDDSCYMDSSLFMLLVANSKYGKQLLLESRLDSEVGLDIRVIDENLCALASVAYECGHEYNSKDFEQYSKSLLMAVEHGSWSTIQRELDNVVSLFDSPAQGRIKDRITRLVNVTMPRSTCINIQDPRDEVDAKKKIQVELKRVYSQLHSGEIIR
jgi:hypothetical protein